MKAFHVYTDEFNGQFESKLIHLLRGNFAKYGLYDKIKKIKTKNVQLFCSTMLGIPDLISAWSQDGRELAIDTQTVLVFIKLTQ